MDKILIVDDEEEIRRQLKWALMDDYEVMEAADKESALGLFKERRPSLVALDLSLNASLKSGEEEGMELLAEFTGIDPKVKVIMITGNDDKKNILKAINKGAYDYYLKPIKLEEIKVILRRALYIQKLEGENERLARELEEKHTFEEIIGSCPKMQDVFKMIRRVSPTDVTVLINGESGTGKELAARAIHYCSPRKAQPFVVINCGAIPENLLESELFGHEKGAFTDACAKKIGKFELADKGTLFLDEIGELNLSLQVKLLRFLQERVIERVGANERIGLDIRIVAATNSDLKTKIQGSAFREDLYYRLSVVSIFLPPLREREDDILLLANYCLHKFNLESSKKLKGFNLEAIEAIKKYSWPGNIRELENKIRRAVILSNNSFISVKDLDLTATQGENNSFKHLKQAREELDIKFIQEALAKNKGNISLASREIGISRVSFYDLLKKYNIVYNAPEM